MKSLSRVTLVAASSIRLPETVCAMRKSMKHIGYGDAILFTDRHLDLSRYGIRVVRIGPLDYVGYSRFITHELYKHVGTEFALIVQHDGYVLRPERWSDDFLKYDYIGAPWPRGMYLTPDGKEARVGNGGFSLRSKKLLEAPTKLDMPFVPDRGSYNEDGFLCNYNRAKLESYGIRYAPVEVAARFSKEKECDDSYPYPFGFHGRRAGLAGLYDLAYKKSSAAAARTALTRLEDRLRSYGRSARVWLYRETSTIKNDILGQTGKTGRANGAEVYDVFTFLDELDLLEIRLNILDPYVDRFVIIESNETFSGLPKRLVYGENQDRFKKWKHKIIHHVTVDTPRNEGEIRARLASGKVSRIDREILEGSLTSDNVGRDKDGNRMTVWLREYYQKESIKKALSGLDDEDMCFVSDADEIWNPAAKFDYSRDSIFKLRQKVYSYYLNNLSDEEWAGTLATKYKNIKNACLGHLRTARKTRYEYIRNGGWHFTNVGGIDKIRRKLESYGHQEYNTEAIKSALLDKIERNQDFIGRGFHFHVEEKSLPAYILDNKDKYHDLFKNS